MKSFFVGFEISGQCYNYSQNTLRLINEFDKCGTFMENLIAGFIQFSSQFIVSARKNGYYSMCALNFDITLKVLHFLSL